MRQEIVLISGKMGSGKTTLAEQLVTKMDANWKVVHLTFAGILYEIHNEVIAKLMENEIVHPNPGKDRVLLQLLGTEWGRKVLGENVWADALKGKMRRIVAMMKAQTAFPEDVLFVISDCRFRNEFDAFPDALRVRLICNEDTRRQRASEYQQNSSHPSEIDLDNYALLSRFDLYIETGEVDIKGMTSLVAAQIQKNVWREKR